MDTHGLQLKSPPEDGWALVGRDSERSTREKWGGSHPIPKNLHGHTVTMTISCSCKRCRAAWAAYHKRQRARYS